MATGWEAFVGEAVAVAAVDSVAAEWLEAAGSHGGTTRGVPDLPPPCGGSAFASFGDWHP